MRTLLLALLVPLGLAGCISYQEPPPPPKNTTIIVPPGSTVVCPTGMAPPC